MKTTQLDKITLQLEKYISNEFLPEIIINELEIEVNYEKTVSYPMITITHSLSQNTIFFLIVKETQTLIAPVGIHNDSKTFTIPHHQNETNISRLAHLYRKETQYESKNN